MNRTIEIELDSYRSFHLKVSQYNGHSVSAIVTSRFSEGGKFKYSDTRTAFHMYARKDGKLVVEFEDCPPPFMLSHLRTMLQHSEAFYNVTVPEAPCQDN